MANKILLLDSNSLMHRAYHALPNLKTSKGQYTGAIYGFLNILLRLIKEQQPTHIAAAFDLKGPTFRHEMYDGYKATRKPMDEELRQQVEPLKDLIAMMGIPIIALQGYEGDDILGTLSKRFDDECIIVTGDRDSFQLVSDSTKVFWTKKGVTEIEVYDLQRLKEDGFTPKQFIDYKAMMGDPSDNIPGIPGVGEKTAKQLLERFGSLDETLAHADEIGGKTGDRVSQGREMALLSRELATICTSVPVECTLDDIKFDPIYPASVRTRLAELEITSLASRMKFSEGVSAKNHQKTVVDISDLSALNDVKMSDCIALFIDNDVRFAFDSDTEYRIVCSEDLFQSGILFDEALSAVKELIKGRQLICYDFKSMSKTLEVEPSSFFDVMIAAHLARGSAPIKNVEQVLGADGYELGAAELFAEKEDLSEQLADQGLEKLFYEVEQPLSLVLGKMEKRGVRVSMEALKRLEDKYSLIISDLEGKIYEAAGEKFNISSTKQLGEILFVKLGLAHGKRTKTGFSVSDDVLEGLLGEHPIIGYIRDYRHYTKLHSTYVVGFQPLVINGRIHTVYNQCVTTTGRLSSTNPNLQNLPVRSEEAKDIKSAFLPSEGNVLVSADYSQIELRLLAHMSGDEQLIYAFTHDEDIHAMTAAEILDIPIESVTPQQRRDAKAVNFGIIYGISGYGLAENLAIPRRKAAEFIDNYFILHPKVREYMDGCIASAREKGYSETLLGRRRSLSDINSSNYMVRSAAERMAMNTPLQGSAADIIKIAMLNVEKRLENMKSKMILQIHDELIIDASEDEVEEVKKILSYEMEHAMKLSVPLIAEAKAAKDWASLK